MKVSPPLVRSRRAGGTNDVSTLYVSSYWKAVLAGVVWTVRGERQDAPLPACTKGAER